MKKTVFVAFTVSLLSLGLFGAGPSVAEADASLSSTKVDMMFAGGRPPGTSWAG